MDINSRTTGSTIITLSYDRAHGLSSGACVFVVVLVTLATLLLPGCCGVFAQSTERRPGDPINLGHVHQSYSSDASSQRTTVAPNIPVPATPAPNTTAAPNIPTPATPAPNTTSGTTAITTPKAFLRGGVVHSEQMAPVQPGLKVGDTFDESKLDKGSATRSWYRVPPWLAGKWQCDEQTQTLRQDYKTGAVNSNLVRLQVRSDVTYGIQRDRLGGLWDFIDMPQMREVSSEKEVDKDLHTDDSVIFDSDARVIIRFVCTRTAVDNTTNTIRGVFQFEQFSTYFPYGPDATRIEASMKFFDQGGKPTSLLKAWKIGHRIAPVELKNFDRFNQDVRPSFREYLMSNGMENLVPLPQ